MMNNSMTRSITKTRGEEEPTRRAEDAQGTVLKKKLLIGIPTGSYLLDELKRLFGPALRTIIGNQTIKFITLDHADNAKVDGVLTDDDTKAKGFSFGGLVNGIIQNVPTIIKVVQAGVSAYQGSGKGLTTSAPRIGVIDEDTVAKRELKRHLSNWDENLPKPRVFSLKDVNSGQAAADVVVASKNFSMGSLIKLLPTIILPTVVDMVGKLVSKVNEKSLVNPTDLFSDRVLRIAIPLRDALWKDIQGFLSTLPGQKGLEARYRTMLQGHHVEYVHESEPHDIVMTSDAALKPQNPEDPVAVAKEGAVEGTLGLLEGSKAVQNGKNFDWLGALSTVVKVAGTIAGTLL